MGAWGSGKRTPAEVRRIFKLARTNTDKALLAAALPKPKKKTAVKPKGDPLVVAQLAGIQAAKRTAELIPLCHQLPLTKVDVQLEVDRALPGLRARALAKVVARTGVEMEALTAVTVALLTVYDMLKAVDRSMRIDNIRLTRKTGGRSGDFES